jgi:hypothetical protein
MILNFKPPYINMTNNHPLPIPAMHFNDSGELLIEPSPASANTDFDFYMGHWQARHEKLRKRLTGCTDWDHFTSTSDVRKILQGLGNTEQLLATVDGQPFEGMTLRLFDHQTRLWSIYWADSVSGKLDIPVVGSFENKMGHFFCKDEFNRQPIIMLFRWDARDEQEPVWSQAFSPDNGRTWEWNWYMYFSRPLQ